VRSNFELLEDIDGADCEGACSDVNPPIVYDAICEDTGEDGLI
jgi:hypothetical protein